MMIAFIGWTAIVLLLLFTGFISGVSLISFTLIEYAKREESIETETMTLTPVLKK